MAFYCRNEGYSGLKLVAHKMKKWEYLGDDG